MILALCADNAFGMAFHGRRQSKDSAVRQRLLELSGGALRMSAYSARQFEGTVYAADDYLSAARPEDWCFVENADFLPFADEIEQLVIFRWNRDYPADLHFTFPGPWVLETVEDFPGTSHEIITQEVYRK